MLRVQPVDGKVPCKATNTCVVLVLLLLESRPSVKIQKEIFGTVNESTA